MIEAAFERTDVLISLTGSARQPTRERQGAAEGEADTHHVHGDAGQLHRRRRAGYRELLTEGQALASIWAAGRTMHITTGAGTDIAAPIGADEVIVECGYATEPGKNAAFSDGEVSSRPLEGKAEGAIVIDGPGTGIARPATPIRVEVRARRSRRG